MPLGTPVMFVHWWRGAVFRVANPDISTPLSPRPDGNDTHNPHIASAWFWSFDHRFFCRAYATGTRDPRYSPFPDISSKAVGGFPCCLSSCQRRCIQGYSPQERLLPAPRMQWLSPQIQTVQRLIRWRFPSSAKISLPLHGLYAGYRLHFYRNIHRSSAGCWAFCTELNQKRGQVFINVRVL